VFVCVQNFVFNNKWLSNENTIYFTLYRFWVWWILNRMRNGHHGLPRKCTGENEEVCVFFGCWLLLFLVDVVSMCEFLSHKKWWRRSCWWWHMMPVFVLGLITLRAKMHIVVNFCNRTYIYISHTQTHMLTEFHVGEFSQTSDHHRVADSIRRSIQWCKKEFDHIHDFRSKVERSLCGYIYFTKQITLTHTHTQIHVCVCVSACM
jgi:hypothetical protein